MNDRPTVKDCILHELATGGPDSAFKLFRRLYKKYPGILLNTVSARCCDMRKSGEIQATKGPKREWVYSLHLPVSPTVWNMVHKDG